MDNKPETFYVKCTNYYPPSEWDKVCCPICELLKSKDKVVEDDN